MRAIRLLAQLLISINKHFTELAYLCVRNRVIQLAFQHLHKYGHRSMDTCMCMHVHTYAHTHNSLTYQMSTFTYAVLISLAELFLPRLNLSFFGLRATFHWHKKYKNTNTIKWTTLYLNKVPQKQVLNKNPSELQTHSQVLHQGLLAGGNSRSRSNSPLFSCFLPPIL